MAPFRFLKCTPSTTIFSKKKKNCIYTQLDGQAKYLVISTWLKKTWTYILYHGIYFTQHTRVKDDVQNQIFMLFDKRKNASKFISSKYHICHCVTVLAFYSLILFFFFCNRYRVKWSKHAKQYVTVTVKEPKTYPYIRDMTTEVLKMRSEDQLPLFSPVEMLQTDPQRIN